MSEPREAPPKILENLPRNSRVLLIRLRSLGDALLLTPALRAVKQWRPDLRISVLLYEEFGPILQGNPDLEEVLVMKKGGLLSLLSIQRQIRKQKFEACFNMHGGTLSTFLTWTSGARHRLAAGPFPYPWAYTALTPPGGEVLGRDKMHTVEYQLCVFYWTGLPQGEVPPLTLVPQEAARRSVREKLAAAGVSEPERYAVLVPAARDFTMEWPFERYAAIARYLQERHGLVPVLDSLPEEEEKLDLVDKAYGEKLPRLVPLGIAELAALIEGAAIFVGNDSGPVHMAAALQRPAVVLYGSSDSSVWRPWKSPHVVVQNPCDCNPCRGDRCYAFERPQCIFSIREEQVQSAINSLLADETAEQKKNGG